MNAIFMRADRMRQELRYALRSLLRSPEFTLVAVLSIALGIASSTTIFGVVNSVLLRPLPYAEPDRVVLPWNRFSNDQRAPLSEPELIDLRAEIRSFEQVAAYRPAELNLTGDAAPERLSAAKVTANLFAALGSAPQLGREFAQGEELPGRTGVAVLSDELWQRRFGGDPAVVGSTIDLDGRAHVVTGVMPSGFRLPADYQSERPSQVWVPLEVDPDAPGARGRHSLHGVARLHPGATVPQANAELALLAGRWIADGTVADTGFSITANSVRQEIFGDIRPVLLILFAAAAFVLLIACANVANLMLARAESRRRDLAVRAALGAQRRRIIGHLLTESLVIAGIGGLIGLMLAALAIHAIPLLVPAGVASLDDVAIDLRVLAFTAAALLLVVLISGGMPAVRTSKAGLSAPLRDGGRGAIGDRQGHRTRRLLVVGEVAVGVVLVIGAALLTRSFWEMRQVQLGFDPQSVLTLQLTVPAADYAGPEQVAGFYQALGERISAIPGVWAAGATALLPLGQATGDWGIDIDGRIRDEAAGFHGYLQVVTPGYFEAMRIPLSGGRYIDATDRADGAPAVVINERMAERYWSGTNPIGQRIRIRGGNEDAWFTVIGVVGDIRHNAIIEEPRHEMYFPHVQLPLALGVTTASMSLVIRTLPEPLTLAPAVRDAIRTLDPHLPAANVRTMNHVVRSAVAEPLFMMVLLGSFAAIALLLAATGIYAVLAYMVGQRRQEFGVRMALGAKGAHLLRMVLASGLALVSAGIVIGLLAAFGLTRVLVGLLYGVDHVDTSTFVAVPAALLMVALVASYAPARRAMRVDPMTALREE